MRITSIKLHNFMAHRDAFLEIETPVVLIAGNNGVGKSTLRDAIRFAINGDAGRVHTKKDLAQIISYGAKSGFVEIEVDEHIITRDITSGKTTDETPVSADIQYVIDADLFASLDDKARKAYLTRLMGVTISQATIKERLAAYGCKPELVDQILPMLRSGFEAAEKAAAEKATEQRGAWKHIAGENYGSKKADTWEATPTASEDDAKDIAPMELQLADFDNRLQEINNQLNQSTLINEQRDELTAKIQKLESIEVNTNLEADVAIQQATIHNLGIDLDELREKANGANAQQVSCKNCGHIQNLIIEDSSIKPASEGTPSDPAAVETTKEAIQEIEQELQQAKDKLEQLNGELSTAQDNQRKLELYQDQLQAMPVLEDNSELEAEKLSTQEARDALSIEIEAANEANTAVQEAAEKTETAKEIHQLVTQWVQIKDALSPSGIPSKILAETIGPINTLLQEQAETTGWQQVRITQDIDITADDRPYHLLSESEQWRTNAMIAACISLISDTGLLVLDRLDVLDISGRAEAMRWIDQLSRKLDTIFVMATLKAMPALPDNMTGIWIGEEPAMP